MIALGVAWILDGLEITIASNVGPDPTQKTTLNMSAEHEKTAEHPPDLTYTALRCSCRDDDLRLVATTERYLKSHPLGVT